MSERLRNPFVFGRQVAETGFTDRDEELRRLERHLENGINVAVIAPRRYGKSSLVAAALRELASRGIPSVSVDLMTTPTKERFAEKLAQSIHDDLASVLLRARERLRVFASLRITPSMTVDTHGGMTFGFQASPRPGDIDATIERLLELPAELAERRGRRVVVFFDEFQQVLQLDRHLPALMRSVFQLQENVAHVYAGSRRDMMRRLFTDANEPFYKSGVAMELGPISETDFAAFVRAQFERTERAVAEGALDRLLQVTGGHPHATQELAHVLWDVVPHGFTASSGDVDEALDLVLQAENARFTLIWERSTPPQKLLLQALAREPGRPFSNAYRLTHALPPTSGVQRALRPLLDQELVRKDRGGAYDLAEPFLREWILAYAT